MQKVGTDTCECTSTKVPLCRAPAAITELSHPSAEQHCPQSSLSQGFACGGAARDKLCLAGRVRRGQRDLVDLDLREPQLDSCIPGVLWFPLLRGK